jgi:4-hydroxybenzoyl-CoA reductase subunit beta
MLRLHGYAYHRPEELGQALELIAAHPGRALPLAGGTDLVPNMKHRLFTPDHVVALKGIAALRGIDVRDGVLRIGATETLTAVSRHPLVQAHAPSLARAAGLVAGPQLRNMGTLGGNVCLDTRCTYYNQTWFWRQALGFCLKKDGDVCHVTNVGKKCVAAHSADTPPVLMTLGATVELAGPDGYRAVPMTDFFVADGIANTVRAWNELVTAVRVPLGTPRLRTAYRKLRQRNAIDFPLLSVAAAAEQEDDGTIVWLRVVVSALGARPRMLSGIDRIAVGRRLAPDVVEAVCERARAQCHPLENIIVDPDWRRAMVPVYVRRALHDLAAPDAHAARAAAS